MALGLRLTGPIYYATRLVLRHTHAFFSPFLSTSHLQPWRAGDGRRSTRGGPDEGRPACCLPPRLTPTPHTPRPL